MDLCASRPWYRVTPFGREITDMLIAVNRAYNKSDYIPCIVWGRNARYASSFAVGDKISAIGRVQSRQYEKQLEDGTHMLRTAYEVSVARPAEGADVNDTKKAAFAAFLTFLRNCIPPTGPP